MASSGKKTCFDAGKIGFCHCAAVLQTQVPKLCTDLDLGLLYILILGTYSKFARKFPSARRLLSAALLERWPQDGRVKITCTEFWFLVWYADTQLATPLQHRRIQVVRSNKVARKRLTESKGTPAMDLGHMKVVLK